jgi:hypothetical protein
MNRGLDLAKSLYATLVEQHPDGPVNETEISVVGVDDTVRWTMGVAQFSRILRDFLAYSGQEQPTSSELMLTISLGRGADAALEQVRWRIDDIALVQRYCVEGAKALAAAPQALERKVRTHIYNEREVGLRYRYANETELHEEDLKAKFLAALGDKEQPKTFRHAQRYSVRLADRLGALGHGVLRLDCTSVRQGTAGQFGLEILGPDQYEVELELTGLSPDDYGVETVQRPVVAAIEQLLRSLQSGLPAVPWPVLAEAMRNYCNLVSSKFGVTALTEGAGTAGGPATAGTGMGGVGSVGAGGAGTYGLGLQSAASRFFIAPNINQLTYELVANQTLLPATDEEPPTHVFVDKADGQRCLLYVDDQGRAFAVTKDTITLRKSTPAGRGTVSVAKLTPILKIAYTGLVLAEQANSVFDTELLVQTPVLIKIFDVLVYAGNRLTEQTFKTRYENFRKLQGEVPAVDSQPGLALSAKTFYSYTLDGLLTNIKQLQPKYNADDEIIALSNAQYELDGLIFQPLEQGSQYPTPDPSGRVPTWWTVYKWKPTYMLTLDLKLVPMKNQLVEKGGGGGGGGRGGAGDAIGTAGGPATAVAGAEPVQYMKFRAYYSKGENLLKSEYFALAPITLGQPRTELQEALRREQIVECRLTKDPNPISPDLTSYWAPVRIRYDKNRPNDAKVYQDGLGAPVTLESLTVRGGALGGAELALNKANRAVSNYIVFNAAQLLPAGQAIRVLDLGAGPAKSIGSWVKNSRFPKIDILGVDLYEGERQQEQLEADRRLAGMANRNRRPGEPQLSGGFVFGNFNLPFNSQATVSTRIPRAESFDFCSCVFAIHYAMASETTWHTYLDNVANQLRVAGIFTGAYISKAAVLAALNDQRSVEGYLVNESTGRKQELWRIERQPVTDPKSPYGQGILVSYIALYRKNQEYLLDLEEPAIRDTLKRHGLVLKLQRSFPDYLAELQSADDRKIANLIPELQNSPEQQRWFNMHYGFIIEKVGDALPSAPVIPETKTPVTVVKKASETPMPAPIVVKKKTPMPASVPAPAPASVPTPVPVSAPIVVKKKTPMPAPAPAPAPASASVPAPVPMPTPKTTAVLPPPLPAALPTPKTTSVLPPPLPAAMPSPLPAAIAATSTPVPSGVAPMVQKIRPAVVRTAAAAEASTAALPKLSIKTKIPLK